MAESARHRVLRHQLTRLVVVVTVVLPGLLAQDGVRSFARLCMVPAHHFFHPRSGLPQIFLIRLFAKHRRMMIGASEVMAQAQRRSALRMKSWRFLEHHGPKKACYVANNIGNRQRREPRTRHGWMFSSSFKKAS